MKRLVFSVNELEFADLPPFGEKNPFTMLARDEAFRRAFPLFTPEQKDHQSSSPFLNPSAAASLIAAQNRSLPAPPEESSYIVAGQQPGLLTGPLYTILKASGAIALAKKLSIDEDRPILPLFWIASDDHDVLEVNRTYLLGKRYVNPYDGDLGRGLIPQVGEISLEAAKEPLLTFLHTTLPETEFTPWILDLVRDADFSTYATAFRDLMSAIFKEWDLRLLDARSLRPLTAAPLAALVEQWPKVGLALEEGSKVLRMKGLTPPLEKAGFFEIGEGRRVPVEFTEDGAIFREGKLNFQEAAECIRRRPEEFSPNAALRPVLQDAVLPVTASLGGPTELCYLWQIRPIYPLIRATPSLLLPRVSATYLKDAIKKAAEKAGLGWERLFEVREVLNDYVPEEDGDLQIRELEEKGRAWIQEMDAVGREGSPRWIEKSRASMKAQWDKFLNRLREEKLEAQGLGRSRLEKIADALLPKGKAQERVANVMEFLNLYGPEFIRLTLERLDPMGRKHQVVHIETTEEED